MTPAAAAHGMPGSAQRSAPGAGGPPAMEPAKLAAVGAAWPTGGFLARRSRQECQSGGAIIAVTSTQMVANAYREARLAKMTPSLPSRYPPVASTAVQAAEPSASNRMNGSSGRPAQPAA